MRGLFNLGNTCYFNTAVQCLAHVPPLTKHLFSADLSNSECTITKEYQKVVKQLFIHGKTDPVNPRELLDAFRGRFPDFANSGQHDAQEVILHLIDVFEQSIGKEFITDIFNGEDSQETVYPTGISTIKTPFTTLILDVSEPVHLNDLVKHREEYTGIKGYTDNDGVTHNVAAIRNKVATWPKIISFSFSMYDYKFPIEIPHGFMGRKLFACVVHSGVQYGGHYSLLVKRRTEDPEGSGVFKDKWYAKDDESVHEINMPSQLRGQFYQAWFR